MTIHHDVAEETNANELDPKIFAWIKNRFGVNPTTGPSMFIVPPEKLSRDELILQVYDCHEDSIRQNRSYHESAHDAKILIDLLIRMASSPSMDMDEVKALALEAIDGYNMLDLKRFERLKWSVSITLADGRTSTLYMDEKPCEVELLDKIEKTFYHPETYPDAFNLSWLADGEVRACLTKTRSFSLRFRITLTEKTVEGVVTVTRAIQEK